MVNRSSEIVAQTSVCDTCCNITTEVCGTYLSQTKVCGTYLSQTEVCGTHLAQTKVCATFRRPTARGGVREMKASHNQETFVFADSARGVS